MRKIKDYKTKQNSEFILSEIASGKSLSQICVANRWAKTSVFDWLNKNYSEQYACAMRVRADMFCDDIIYLADSAKTKDEVDKAKLQIEARKWVMSKMAPKKYGDKVEVDHGLTDELKEIVVTYVE